MTLMVEIDFRADLGPVRDQGRRPTCLAFAASDAHRHARRHPNLFCVEWLFHHAAHRAHTGPNDGITALDTRAVLENPGQPDEAFWPYSSVSPNPQTWKPPVGAPTLWQCRPRTCGANPAAVCASVKNGVPAVVCFRVSDAFRIPGAWETAGAEIVLGVKEDSSTDELHAVVAVGCGSYRSEPVLLVRNSWGANWGRDGHAWVRESYLGPRLADAFTIIRGDCHVL